MALKITFVIFASALIVQGITARSCGNSCGCSSSLPINTGCCNGYTGNAGLNIGALGGARGYGGGVAVANGGGLDVTLASPLSPSALSVYSENAINGALDVRGALPVLSAVGIDCSLPTSGSAGVQYGCGNGNIGITSNCGGYGFGSGSAGGYGGASGGWTGLRGSSCGCGCN